MKPVDNGRGLAGVPRWAAPWVASWVALSPSAGMTTRQRTSGRRTSNFASLALLLTAALAVVTVTSCASTPYQVPPVAGTPTLKNLPRKTGELVAVHELAQRL